MTPANTAARIAAAQLSGLSRSRTLVQAGPFTGLLAPGGPQFLNYTVAARPGEPVEDPDEVAAALRVLREAFPEGTLRFELVDEAAPGAARALADAGLSVTMRVPVMTVTRDALVEPDPAPGVVVSRVTTTEHRLIGDGIAHRAFGGLGEPVAQAPAPDARDGGMVLAWVDGTPVAVASWTAVADGVTEVVGIATAEEHRRQGFGALVTAAATRVPMAEADVDLAWLTPGSADADRVYRQVGYRPVATAVHLAEEPAL
ncbi:GNAT family N-acetyltransferase [Actinokineospora sp. G85]|uniref:GNAT family N-acetyltransferase n=1 Tax=Actinokineospora sp. G85 TaxID=3406626 RepID=UPI003C71F5EF